MPAQSEHTHNYIANPTLTWRDIDGTPYIQTTYNCECGAGKYERVPANYLEDDGESHNIRPHIDGVMNA